MADKTDDESNKFADLVLESPPETAAPIAEIAQSMFGDESIGTMTAKLNVVESLLKLATRDIRFNDFTREILMTVMRTVKCEASSIFEVNPDTNTLFFRAATGRSSDQVSKFEIPMGQGIVGYVAESRQPMMVADVRGNHMHAKTISQAVDFEARNLIAVPLIIRGHAYGVLELLNRIGEPHFSTADLELLTYIGEMVSKVIELRLMLNWAKNSGKATKEAA